MIYPDSITKYMIAALCIIAFCLIFSGVTKKIIKIGARGIAGLIGIYALNTIIAGSGIAVGINIINGLFIGLFGFPAFAGLYIIQFFIN